MRIFAEGRENAFKNARDRARAVISHCVLLFTQGLLWSGRFGVTSTGAAALAAVRQPDTRPWSASMDAQWHKWRTYQMFFAIKVKAGI